MAFNSIRTKIIGGYVLFVLLILSFIGLNYLLVSSTVRDIERVYISSEWARQEMETENIFWRQVIAMTDYFLTGDEAHYKEFQNYRKILDTQFAALASSTEGEPETNLLLHLRSNYDQFVAEFEKATTLYRAGKIVEAKDTDRRVIDPLEEEVEIEWERLLELRNKRIQTVMTDVRTKRKYSGLMPSLNRMIDSTEEIYNDNEALQHSLEAEEHYLKQVIALTDLFAFNQDDEVGEIHQFGEVFLRELRLGQSFAKTNEENQLLNAIEAKRRNFIVAFTDAVNMYGRGDRVGALRVENERVDPAEAELETALKQFYPLKEADMKRSFDDVLLVDTTSLSITRSIVVYISLLLLIGLVGGAILAIRITKPTKILAEATQKIAAGDFNARSEVKTRDEIGQLSSSFNQMAENLQRTTVSKDYVNLIIESMGDALVVTSSEGLILTVNAATCLILGYTEKELIGKSEHTTFHHTRQDGRPYPRVESPIYAAFNDGIVQHVNDEVFWKKDGTSFPVEYVSTPIHENGKLMGAVVTFHDIAERLRIETELKQSEFDLIESQHLALLGNWDWEVATNKTTWSAALYRIYGIEPNDYPPTYEGYLGLVHPDDRQNVAECVDTALRTGQGVTYRHRVIWHDQSVHVHYVILRVLLDEAGHPKKLFGTAQDVTERVQMEEELKLARDEALESMRVKSEFLANMSHEIRTPMNGVIGMAGILLDTQLTTEQKEFADTIRTSGEALVTIINDILDFSKIEAGKLNFETVDFDLNNVIEGAVELLAERAYHKRIELASIIFDEVPTGLMGDPGRLRQVLTNLIGNAIKFTESGEVVVRAEKVKDIHQDVVIRFSVTDTGIGISEKAQKHLFQPFVQADGSTTRKYGGTGLGLAISKQLVELMGGQIGVKSTDGDGATFWFTARFEKQPFQPADTKSDSRILCGLHALIVDDNAANRKILSHQLGGWGITHDEADSGSQALELLRSAADKRVKYDLAILDLMMPGMDGFELARVIKSDPNICEIKMLLLTSFGQRGDGSLAREAGVSAYLTKPIRNSQLNDCLTKMMRKVPVMGKPDDAETGPDLITKHALAESLPSSTKLILLAEDNVVNQKVAVRQLRKLGYRAKVVANGLETLEALKQIPYDLVLMDCQMPEMDGYEATAEIRLREGTEKHTPIVAMTAHALDGDREKCIAAGMDDYISKPVKPEQLGAVLERLLFDSNGAEDSILSPASEDSLLINHK